MRNKWITFIFLALPFLASASDAKNVLEESFFASGKIYVTVAVISIILIGLFIYLFTMDRRISKVEQEIKEK